MGNNRGAAIEKRQRERARQQKKQEKAERRAKRNAEKREHPRELDGVDPDIAGIVPGPQPPSEE